MKAAIVGGVGAAILIATGLFWWNADRSDDNLVQRGIQGAAALTSQASSRAEVQVAPIRPTAKIALRQPADEGWERVVFEMSVPRTEVTTHGGRTITPEGELQASLAVLARMDGGNLGTWPPRRPTWEIQAAGWKVEDSSGEALWERAKTDPAAAAFDSRLMMSSDMLGIVPVVTYISSLRRLKMWPDVLDYFEGYEFRFFMRAADHKWLARVDEEFDALEASEMKPEDKKRLQRFLSTMGRPMVKALRNRLLHAGVRP